jgi:hypothetical protein
MAAAVVVVAITPLKEETADSPAVVVVAPRETAGWVPLGIAL